MTPLAEAFALAERYLAEVPTADAGCECYTCHELRSPSMQLLARALLDVRATVEAAGKQADAEAALMASLDRHVEMHDAWVDACDVTEAAVRKLRGAR